MSEFFIGTAAWTLPKEHSAAFPSEGTHLQRYAQRLRGVEINSSFYREHKAITYRRWSESVPEDFRFSVKLSKAFTHVQRLDVNPDDLKLVLEGIRELGEKWGALLVQMPPSLGFDLKIAKNFFSLLRTLYNGLIAVEPRHTSWVSKDSDKVMNDFNLTKVFADPEPCPVPGDKLSNRRSSAYLRLHGSPEIYKSNYTSEKLHDLSSRLKEEFTEDTDVWCVFDNTTFGHATANALELDTLVQRRPPAFQKESFLLHSPDA